MTGRRRFRVTVDAEVRDDELPVAVCFANGQGSSAFVPLDGGTTAYDEDEPPWTYRTIYNHLVEEEYNHHATVTTEPVAPKSVDKQIEEMALHMAKVFAAAIERSVCPKLTVFGPEVTASVGIPTEQCSYFFSQKSERCTLTAGHYGAHVVIQ